MSSLFRSDEMSLCQFYLQPESAYLCVSELGELSLAQFIDCNPAQNVFQRQFINEVRRCEEMERKLRYVETELNKNGIQIEDTEHCPEAPHPKEITDLETIIENLDLELREINGNSVTLKRHLLQCLSLKEVLAKSNILFNEQRGEGQDGSLFNNMIAHVENPDGQPGAEGDATLSSDLGPLPTAPVQGTHLGFVAGVIPRERIAGFERMIWRVSRGNVFLRYLDIEEPLEDPLTGDPVLLSTFLIFFQGDQLLSRVKKICAGFRATLYPLPNTAAERHELGRNVKTRMEDLKTVLAQTDDHRRSVVQSASKKLKIWLIKVRKIKAIYHTMNLFNLNASNNCFIADAWIPTVELDNVRAALKRGTDKAGTSIQSILNPIPFTETPPTFNRVNKFTRVFQNLIDAFGIATYRELNPAPYTIITFPFLFAVMFGDAGHAVIMGLFGLWMVVKEKELTKKMKKWDSEIFNMFFGGRYVILLMGIFSFYTGLIYNDVFSKSMNIFGSSWFVNNHTRNDNNYNRSGLTQHYIHTQKTVMLDPITCYKDHPYPMGLDPGWQVADNKISFLNAYKMKISIIIGVIHMLFGVSLSLWNHIHFKKPLHIIFGFIPQTIFLLFLFMYLNALVFTKWVLYNADGGDERGSHCAPSILITFINMVLFSAGEPPDLMCPSAYMFEGQKMIQQILVVVALLCVPWMLFIQPFIMRSQHRKRHPPKPVDTPTAPPVENGTVGAEDGDIVLSIVADTKVQSHGGGGGGHGGHGGDSDTFDMADVFINQGLHTIEFVLGSISHTASYLRLWALSLAHAQLSEVLWSMVMRIGLQQTEYYGAIILFAIFAAWAVLTVAILVLMEGLSAFLHTLRLHWIEFQSKFYAGEGYPFAPFSFKQMLDAAEGDDEEA